MEYSTIDTEDSQAVGPRKPRVALMGEFSAGKSTLTNMLLGESPVPTRVTATRLPPVWISYGEPCAVCVGLDGSETEIDIADIDQVDLDTTLMVRLSLIADTLQLCDLIDMPGISDPNMTTDVWQPVFDEADSVIWCTHATQAWRQSEAATWEAIREQTNGDNLLLITQFDKLQSDRDRARVLARVRKEVGDTFAGLYPVSLLDALNAGEDEAKWQRSGAGRFTEHFVEMLLNPGGEADEPEMEQADEDEAGDAADPTVPKVVPKRVHSRASGPRPERLPRRSGVTF